MVLPFTDQLPGLFHYSGIVLIAAEIHTSYGLLGLGGLVLFIMALFFSIRCGL